jgi:hypothetical protein
MLPTPGKQFKAARLYPCVPKWLRANLKSVQYFVADNIAIDDYCDYRYVQYSDREVLLVTPKGLETLAIKQQLYTNGWRWLLEKYPEFKLFDKTELGLSPIPEGAAFTAPAMVFGRSIKTDEVRKAGILYPSVEVVGCRYA